MKKLLSAALLSAMAVSANAGIITVSDSEVQALDYQDFLFNLPTSDLAAGSPSLLTVTVQGDFNSGIAFGEDIVVLLEGTSYGNFSFNSPAAYDVIDYTAGVDNFNTYQFSVDFILDAVTTASLLADDVLSVAVNFGNSVNEGCGWSGEVNCTRTGNAPFAAVSYSYEQGEVNVPAPATLGLFLMSIFAARQFGRKR